MDTNANRDVYQLIAELVNTSEQLSSNKTDVVINTEPEQEEIKELNKEVKQEPEKPSTNIRIVDSGFVNLTRLVTEQKDLISKLNEKINEFETEVEKEGAKKGKEPISIEDLRAELLNFTNTYNTQFSLRIKGLEETVSKEIHTANQLNYAAPTLSNSIPMWMYWLNVILMSLVAILLALLLFKRSGNLTAKAPSIKAEPLLIEPTVTAIDSIQFPVQEANEMPEDEIVTVIEPAVSPLLETDSAKKVVSIADAKKNVEPVVVSNPNPLEIPNEEAMKPAKPIKKTNTIASANADTIKSRSDVFFGED